jgi:hypothetical protein
MKALNRKASSTSLMNDTQSQSQQQYQQSFGALDRGSVPPGPLENSRSLSKTSKTATPSKTDTTPRAKSATKELHRDDSQKSNDSGSSLLNSGASRFFTLTRRIGDKIRFRTSSQPPAPLKSTSDLTRGDQHDGGSDYNLSEISDIRNNKISTKSQSSQFLAPPPDIEVQAADEEATSKPSKHRDRAMSPGKFLSSLRARSPFGKSSRNSRASSATPSAASIAANTTTISGRNKGFTISLNNQTADSSIEMSPAQATSTPRNQFLTSASYQSTSINSNNSYNNNDMDDSNVASTYSPSTTASKLLNRFMRSGTSERNTSAAPNNSRSISCDFADNGSIGSASSSRPNPALSNSNTTQLKQLSEANDEFEDAYGGDNQSNSSYSAQQSQQQQTKVSASLNKNVGSKVEMLRKSFMESQNNSVEVVKSVKFKDMPVESGSASKPSSVSSTNLADKSLGKPPLMNVFTPNVTSTGSSNNNSGNNSVSGTPNSRAKFLGIRARTIDFPDLLQNAMENSTTTAESAAAGSKSMLSPAMANTRPIQSILRRSETPPNVKSNFRQQLSVESSDSNMDRLLKSSTSTSRPLMFNGN